MSIQSRWSLLALVFLSACGGGGGGGGDSGDAQPAIEFSLTPSRLEGKQYQGDLQTFVVTARVTRVVGEPAAEVVARIVDSAGVIAGSASIEEQPDGTYRARLESVRNLAVGSHAGTLRVQVCADTA